MSAASPSVGVLDDSEAQATTSIVSVMMATNGSISQPSDIASTDKLITAKKSPELLQKQVTEKTSNEPTLLSEPQPEQTYEPLKNLQETQNDKHSQQILKSEIAVDKSTPDQSPLTVEHDQTNQPEPDSPSTTSSTSISNLSLSERFSKACREVPPPKWNPSSHDTATPSQRTFLVENSSGILLLSPIASKQPCEASRSAARLAIEIAAGSSQKPSSIQSPSRHEEGVKQNSRFKLPLLSDTPPSVCKSLQSFEWQGSLSESLLTKHHEKILQERKAKEETDGKELENGKAAIATKLKPASKESEKKLDPILWAAQEASAGVSLLREIRTAARSKKPTPRSPLDGSIVWSLLSSKAGRLKPEAAAEMARARFAAAEAAKVMRESEPTDGVPHGKISQLAVQDNDAEDLLMLKSFRPTISLDQSPATSAKKERKRVVFAPGTVFERK